MSAIATRNEFFSIIAQSKLVDDDVLEKLRESQELSERSGECAEQLIKQGVITRFQAKQLLAGKHRGFVLGPYRILDQIGKGGMGTVYLGEHSTLKRRVAVKVLARELAENKTAVERFLREARSASSLTHQNIVRVHHVGQAAGTHYIAMEYVEGVTLEQVVDRKGPFSVAETAQIAIQAATGLQHAHERGFVHRDIKPENLMMTKDGMVKILDMGLTKNVGSESDNLTGVMNAKGILGTLDYLSPEQAIQGPVDARSDIYSLGASIFMLITGHSPYDGVPNQQKLMQHQYGKVPLLSEFRAEIPTELVAIVAKMMAKNPDNRFASCADIAVAFLPWSTDQSLNASVKIPSMISGTGASGSLTPTPSDVNRKTLSGVSVLPTMGKADGEAVVADSRKTADLSGVSTLRSQTREVSKSNSKKPRGKLHPIWWVVLAVLGSLLGLGAAIAVAKFK
jgi:eukaryotic-like serine/threonine-protein kinase